MNTNQISTTPTLSELADIGAKASRKAMPDIMFVTVDAGSTHYAGEAPAREAFAKSVLDAVGYKLPVDPEREAFDAWIAANPSRSSNDDLFEAWKAGRAARDKEVMRDKQPNPETFEAHGHTWFKHTPGDPMPVGGDVKITYFTTSEMFFGVKASQVYWGVETRSKYPIIGWRHA